MEPLYVINFLSTLKIDPHESITDFCMFDGASNVQPGGELLKIHYPKVSVMSWVEHTASLLFNDVYKIPSVNQMITSHKAMYNLFVSGTYHKPHSIFKSKSYEFHHMKIGLFSGNDTRMADYFIWMHRSFSMRKVLLATFSSAEFNTMLLKLEISKVVSYIQDNKYWEGIYVILKILFPLIFFIRLADSNKVWMDKIFYYARMTKISIIKSSSDLDNKEIFPVSRS